MVFPDARHDEVEAVVRATLHKGAPEELSLVIVRVAATEAWAVAASGLDDAEMQRGIIDVLEEALRATPATG
jgi:hypothetical protein